MQNYRLDWTIIGQPFTSHDEQRKRILDAIAAIDAGSTGPGEWDRWLEIPKEGQLAVAMMPGEAIKTAIRELKLPRVSHVGISVACSPCGFYGIRAHYGKNGEQRVDVFVMDTGGEITPIICRAFDQEASGEPRKTEDAFTPLRGFLGPNQAYVIAELMTGEEGGWFHNRLAELAEIIRTMPKTYKQSEGGEQAIAYLHYFAGGSANWYITEKHAGSATDTEVERGQQLQAFGLADLFGDGGEVGYISIAEILANGGELDLHWTPKTLAEIRGKTESEVA